MRGVIKETSAEDGSQKWVTEEEVLEALRVYYKNPNMALEDIQSGVSVRTPWAIYSKD